MAFSSAAVSVATGSATVVYTFTNGIDSIVVQNLDAANPIYLGGSDVTSVTGLKLAAGASLPITGQKGEVLYARATGGACDTRVLKQGL